MSELLYIHAKHLNTYTRNNKYTILSNAYISRSKTHYY